MLNSKARRDKCGICGGDNSSCKTLAGTFNSAHYGMFFSYFTFKFCIKYDLSVCSLGPLSTENIHDFESHKLFQGFRDQHCGLLTYSGKSQLLCKV